MKKILGVLQMLLLALTMLVLFLARTQRPHDLLAYIVASTNQGWDITLMDGAMNSTVRLEPEAMNRPHPLFWSSDCLHLAFASNDGITALFVTDIEMGAFRAVARTVVDNSLSPTWSPDGHQLAFEDSNQIRSIDLDVPRGNLLSADNYSVMPTWSPNGRQIAYLAANSTPLFQPRLMVRLMDADRRNKRWVSSEVYALGFDSGTPQWSPDGSLVAVTGRIDSIGFELLTLEVASGALMRLAKNLPASTPVWSPDGSEIAFVSRQTTGSSDLYVVNADGSNLRNLTHNPGVSLTHNRPVIVSSPSWSPDGNEIVFAEDNGGASELYTISLDNGQVWQLSSRYKSDKLFPTWCRA